MPFEVLSAIAAIGTFLVIAATAVAALIQLRHIRANNELVTLKTVMAAWDSEAFQRAVRFVRHELPARMADPAFRAEIDTREPIDRITHPELVVCDFWDTLGVYVMHGMIRESAFLGIGTLAAAFWRLLSPTVAIMRRQRGRGVYAGFEYLADTIEQLRARFPDGYIPKSWQRPKLEDPWLGT